MMEVVKYLVDVIDLIFYKLVVFEVFGLFFEFDIFDEIELVEFLEVFLYDMVGFWFEVFVIEVFLVCFLICFLESIVWWVWRGVLNNIFVFKVFKFYKDFDYVEDLI